MWIHCPFQSFVHKKRKDYALTQSLSSMARCKGFCPGAPAPIASLRSLPRQRKQSTGLFSSEILADFSFLVRIPFGILCIKKRKDYALT